MSDQKSQEFKTVTNYHEQQTNRVTTDMTDQKKIRTLASAVLAGTNRGIRLTHPEAIKVAEEVITEYNREHTIITDSTFRSEDSNTFHQTRLESLNKYYAVRESLLGKAAELYKLMVLGGISVDDAESAIQHVAVEITNKFNPSNPNKRVQSTLSSFTTEELEDEVRKRHLNWVDPDLDPNPKNE